MKFDGSKGGVAWESTLEIYLSGKCPMIMELLKWPEKHGEDTVSDVNLAACVAGSMLDAGRQEFYRHHCGASLAAASVAPRW